MIDLTGDEHDRNVSEESNAPIFGSKRPRRHCDSDVVSVHSSWETDSYGTSRTSRRVHASTAQLRGRVSPYPISTSGPTAAPANDQHTLNGVPDTGLLSHRREDCPHFPYVSGRRSSKNAAYCPQCVCVKCDKPVGDCRSWGDGSLIVHHCNIDSTALNRLRYQRGEREPHGATQNPAAQMNHELASLDASGEPTHSSPPGEPQPKTDEASAAVTDGCDQVDLDTLMAFLSVLINSDLGDEQHHRACNNESSTGAAACVLGLEHLPVPDASTSVPADGANSLGLDELAANYMNWGTLKIPVKVSNSLNFDILQSRLAATPWGGRSRADITDWETWHRHYPEEDCFQSIMLYLDSNRANTRGPERNTQPEAERMLTIDALPRIWPSNGKPPVDFVLRACLIVDCYGMTHPQYAGIKTWKNSTLGSIASQIAWVLGLECHGESLEDGSQLLFGYRDPATRELRMVAPDQIIQYESTQFMTCEEQQLMTPLIVWRVAPCNSTNDLATSSSQTGSPSYLCVDILRSTATSCTAGQAEAGLLPVPVMLPANHHGHRLFRVDDDGPHLERGAIVQGVLDIFWRWQVLPAGTTSLAYLQEQVYSSVPCFQQTGEGTPTCTISQLRTSDLQHSLAAQLQCESCPSVACVAMLLDRLHMHGQAEQGARADDGSPLQLQDLVDPPRLPSVSPYLLRLHQEYISVRAKVEAAHSHDQALILPALRAVRSCSCTDVENGPETAGRFTLLKAHTALCHDKQGRAALHIALYGARAAFMGSPHKWSYKLIQLDSVLHLLLRESVEFQHMRNTVFPPVDHVQCLTPQDIMELTEAPPDLPEADEPGGLAPGITLPKYQRQTLGWMLDMEECTMLHKFWLRLPTMEDVYYSPVFRLMKTSQPRSTCAGILAHEAGLGKTVISLALHLAHPAPCTVVAGSPLAGEDSEQLVQSRATLVVCKRSSLQQWVTDARSKLQGDTITICQHHGPKRILDTVQLARADLVVTTYEILTHEYQKHLNGDTTSPSSPMLKIKWWRIIFDDSHVVSSEKTTRFQACNALQSDQRWACTRAPATCLASLRAQFEMLHADHLAPTSEQMGRLRRGSEARTRWRVAAALRGIMLQHSKATLASRGECPMPPKTEEIVPVHLTDMEWQQYKQAHARISTTFRTCWIRGPEFCQAHAMQIMALLMPLRRLCSGAECLDAQFNVSVFMEAGRSGQQCDAPCYPPEDSVECPVCWEVFLQPARTVCGHWFCRDCITRVLSQQGTCPLCRKPSAVKSLQGARYPVVEADADAGGEPLHLQSKLKAMKEQLSQILETHPESKVLVLTGYPETIPCIEQTLTRSAVAFRSISGRVLPKQRTAALEAFKGDRSIKVLIATQSIAATGINLAEANVVFIMEPLLNAALDAQAVGCAWRMGQKQPVTVKRLYVKGSVEEHIMEVVRDRPSIQAELCGASGKEGRVSQAAEKAKIRAEELQKLFAIPACTAVQGKSGCKYHSTPCKIACPWGSTL